ncbi:MAG TPA: cytochrome c oxidase assembly protein [Rickettsiales bacterium]|nr:cytochrome c oxidase assembly protein [Rickettsiales bacterium]
MSIKQSIILFVSAILLGLLMILPFNLICKSTDWCEPIVISYYLPSKHGNEGFEIFFEAKDNSEAVNIEVKQRLILVLTGQKAQVQYNIMNPLRKQVKISPKLYIVPQEAAKYLKFYDCLCFKERKIGAREIKSFNVRFKLDRKIEEDEFFKNQRNIRIGYEIE